MGSELLTEALRYYCRTNTTVNMTSDKCFGFTVYPPDKFYDFDYSTWPLAFEPKNLPEFIKITLKSSIFHFAHSITHNIPFNVTENEGYAVMAKVHCPSVYNLINNTEW